MHRGCSDDMAPSPARPIILMNLEPELDSYNPQQTLKALDAAELVVMLSAYKSQHACTAIMLSVAADCPVH